MAVIDHLRAWIAGTMPADRVLRRRASAILKKSRIRPAVTGRQTIVDLGCGTGHLGEALLQGADTANLVMIDPAWGPSRRLRRRLDKAARGRWRHVSATAQDLPLDSGSADLVLLAFVLHHTAWGAQRQILDEAWRVLKPDGQLVLVEDTPRGGAEIRRTVLADRILNAQITPDVHNYRTDEEWRDLLSASGFRVDRHSQFQGLPPRVICTPVRHSCLVAKKIPGLAKKISSPAEK